MNKTTEHITNGPLNPVTGRPNVKLTRKIRNRCKKLKVLEVFASNRVLAVDDVVKCADGSILKVLREVSKEENADWCKKIGIEPAIYLFSATRYYEMVRVEKESL